MGINHFTEYLIAKKFIIIKPSIHQFSNPHNLNITTTMSVKNNVHNTHSFYKKPVEVQGVDTFPGKPTLPDVLTKSSLSKKKEKMAA